MFGRKPRNNSQSATSAQALLDRNEEDLVLGQDIDTGEDVTLSLSGFISHLWAPGAPGTGKTTLLELILRWLFCLHQGFVLLDPIGVLFDRLVRFLSFHPDLAQDVVILSARTRPYWLGWNPLQRVPYIVSSIVHGDLTVECFKKVCRDEGNMPLFDRKTGEAAEPISMANLTIDEMNYFTRMDDAAARARRKIVPHSSDEGIKQEWATFDSLTRRQKYEELGSLRNRLPKFTRNRALNCILGRTRNTLTIPELVDGPKPKQLLVDLSPQDWVFGKTHGYLLGTLLFSHLCAYMRTRTPEQAAQRMYFCASDETHNLLSSELSAALDELRNFSLRCLMANQRFGQLLREDRDLLDAFLTDSGIKAVFGRVAPAALAELEPLIYTDHDLTRVKYQRYSGNEASPDFYSLAELHYMRQAEMYRQPTAHMTWKYLEQPARKMKVTSVEPYPVDEGRIRELIQAVIRNHRHWYLHEDEALKDIEERHKALEASEDDDAPKGFRDTKRANLRKRRS